MRAVEADSGHAISANTWGNRDVNSRLFFFHKFDHNDKPISCVHDFCKDMEDFAKQHPGSATSALWFRGQANIEWRLEPSIARCGVLSRTDERRNTEIQLLMRFRLNLHAYLRREPSLW